VVSPGHPAQTQPLGAGPRFWRAARSVGVLLYRYRHGANRHHRLLRASLVGRSHIRRTPRTSRRRDATPADRQGHRPNHTRPLRTLQPDLPLGLRTVRRTQQAPRRCMVSKNQPLHSPMRLASSDKGSRLARFTDIHRKAWNHPKFQRTASNA
jgi:hypothetical protein